MRGNRSHNITRSTVIPMKLLSLVFGICLVVVVWGGVCERWGVDLGNWGSVYHGSGGVGLQGGGVDLSYGGGVGDLSGFVGQRFLVYNCIETVVGISGVIDGAFGAIGVNDRVGALDDVTITSFMLGFGVTGETILYVIGEAVLRVSVIFLNGNFGYGSDCGVFGHWSCISHRSGMVDWSSGVVCWSTGVGQGGCWE